MRATGDEKWIIYSNIKGNRHDRKADGRHKRFPSHEGFAVSLVGLVSYLPKANLQVHARNIDSNWNIWIMIVAQKLD